MAGSRWTEYELEQIKNLWPTKGSKEVAVLLGKTWKSVQVKAIRMGLVCDQKASYERRRESLTNNNSSCDIEYFNREWNPNFAYILGYTFADGSINKSLYMLSFLCHSKDEEIILAIHKELKSEHLIGRRPAKEYPDGRKNGPRTYLNISSKKLVMSLVTRFGLLPRKTYLDLKMPEIPDKYFGHFLRGYFDGDGHVHKRKQCNGGVFSFVGTKTFVEQMGNRISELIGVRKPKLCQQGLIYSIEWNLHKELKEIYELMYPEGEYIFLNRKRLVFTEIANQVVREDVPWTLEDEQKVIDLYHKIGRKKLARMLGRTKSGVQSKARQLDVPAVAKNKLWTYREDL